MSAVPAEKIRHPEELELPSREKIEAVLDFLTPDGAKAFAHAILEALHKAKSGGDLRHVNHVVESWYRTLLFKTDSDHDARWERAQEVIAKKPKGLDLEEVRSQLDLE